MKKVFIFIAFLLFANGVSAQVSNLRLGAGGGVTYYTGDISDTQYGIKVLGEINLAKEFALSLGYLSNFPSKVKPSRNKVDDGTKVDFNSLNLNLLLYINSSVTDDFSLFVPIGLSTVWGKYRTHLDFGADSFLYQETVSDVTLNLGFGFHKKIGNPVLFSELTISFPVNSEGVPQNNVGHGNLPSSFSDNKLPFYGTLIMGIKLPVVTEFKKRKF